MTKVLSASGIHMSFGGVKALRNGAMEVPAGNIVGLIGRNGSGKSTLFNCITGFCRPQAGKVMLGERDITGLEPHRIVEHGIVRTFARLPRAAWIEALRQKRVPCGPERTYAEVVADDDLLRRGMLYRLQSLAGSSLQVRMPVSFLEHDLAPARAAPTLGDADAVLASRQTDERG